MKTYRYEAGTASKVQAPERANPHSVDRNLDIKSPTIGIRSYDLVMVGGTPPRVAAAMRRCGLELQDAREMSKWRVVPRDHLGRYPPFAALRGPRRGAVE